MQRVAAEPFHAAVNVAGANGGERSNVLIGVKVDVQALSTDGLSVGLRQEGVNVERFLEVQHRVAGTVGCDVLVHAGLERTDFRDLQR